MSDEQTAGEPVACRCGKCPALGLVDVDLSDKAHPRPREQAASEPVALVVPAYITKALHSLAKGWPIVAAHASHMDGEFSNALDTVRRYIERAPTPHPRPRVGVTRELVSNAIRETNGRDDVEWASEIADYINSALPLADEAAPGVVELDEWRVVDCNGVEQEVNGTAFSAAEGREFAVWHDKRFPQVAPHRVMRVCLKPLANGGGEVGP